jgi:hypothetical protein
LSKNKNVTAALIFFLISTFAPVEWCVAKERPLISPFGTTENLKAVRGFCYKVFWPARESGDEETYIFSEADGTMASPPLAYMMIDGVLTTLTRSGVREKEGMRHEHWSAPQVKVTLTYVYDEELRALESDGFGEHQYKGATLTLKKGRRRETIVVAGRVGC